LVPCEIVSSLRGEIQSLEAWGLFAGKSCVLKGLSGVTETLYLANVQDVLAGILASETFRRADQLKRLVSYLVEQDQLGRIHEVTEYELGTKALGRPEDFSPETDSTVRTRMHALRQKLEDYYRREAPESGVKLSFPKGSYRPTIAETVAAVSPDIATPKPRWWLAFAGVAVLALLAYWFWPANSPLESFWRPVLRPGRSVALLVGQPVHLWVRDIQGQADPKDYAHFPDPLPQSQAFLNFVRPRVPNNAKLVLHPSPNATLWGDAAGAAAAARFLAFRGVNSELLPESTLRSGAALRGRPVLAFGRPEFSPAIQRYLAAAGGYTVGMRNDLQRYSIHRLSDPKDFVTNTFPPNEVNHGLVTVLEDGEGKVIVFSGITSDGSIASFDYMTNEENMKQLWQRMASEGLAQWPSTFQVVLKVNSSQGYAMGAQYEKHLVLKP
jgi:hypothetical protein